MTWQLSRHVRWLSVEDDVIIFNSQLVSFIDLTGSGADLWHVLSKSDWSEEAACQYLSGVCSMSAPDAVATATTFLTDLERSHVLVQEPGPHDSGATPGSARE